MARIAVLLTSHNRREATLASLRAIRQQEYDREKVCLEVFLMDDGSQDGTVGSVSSKFPAVHVLQGDGSHFWTGGMRAAFAEAMKGDFDYYLWLNDDTILTRDAVSRLIQVHESADRDKAIIVGSVMDEDTGAVTYGGVIRPASWKRHSFVLVRPAREPLECETMNGNCVLIPAAVVRLVGNLDGAYTHGIGDFDYGLRARKQGVSVLIAPGFIGTCSRNSVTGTWQDSSLPLRSRLRKAASPKGLPPREWLTFVRRHTGPLWPLYWISPYARLIIDAFSGAVGAHRDR